MKVAVTLLATLALAGCGGHHEKDATELARSWSSAIDRGDDEGAARLFANGATIVQNGRSTLETHADAVRWNASLPCGGRITSIEEHGKSEVLVVFELQQRPRHRCDAPGGAAAALFEVEHGQIVLWHQTDVPVRLQPQQTI